MRKFYFLFFLFLFFSYFSFSQKEVYNYARKIVDTMASESMHGRGYVNDGDKIAANYIKTEFQKFGLKSFNENYYQHFNFDINTFPSETVSFVFNFYLPNKNGNFLIFKGLPGVNFIVDPSSPSVKSSFDLILFDSTDASPKAYKKFCKKIKPNQYILIDDKGVKNKTQIEYFKKARLDFSKSGGIIEIIKKLTWSQSQVLSSNPKIEVLEDSIHYIVSSSKKKGPGSGGIWIQNKFIQNYQSQNVIGYIEGSTYPDSFIIFSAHYDHLGQMGRDVYFPGANDNASGCAMLLNLAKHYSKSENKPKCSIAFIAFGAEEVGLLGSKFYTEHPLFPLNKIKFVFNMDIMGTGEEGITVVNGAIYKNEFEKLKQINSENNFIKDVKPRGKAANSDHYFFSEKGVKAFFIYTMGGIKAYHDIYDRPETLPLNEFENLFKLITNFSAYLQN